MLFNSYEFILAFLPATFVLFVLLGRFSRSWALGWLIVASVFFYACWRPVNVLIIAPSIVVNYLLARALLRLGSQEKRAAAQLVLVLGIVFNIAFLGYFKYANFAVRAVNDAFGTGWVLEQIILPLGISFITFQKIAFLIDVYSQRVQAFTLRDYCLFVLFFPQLIAGPIVHYREMMPQFHRAACRFDAADLSVGLTLFVFGLFKKVCLADGIAPSVNALFEQASAGGAISLVPAWMAAVGFTLQIYFDFSGYTDMALGIARCFGIRLPPNFDSPLKASSIIDFWLRWHMTLTRFLTAYVYNPLALTLTRRRLARGKLGLVGRNTTLGAFLYLLMFPTLLTMLLSGIWHGAGYLFVLWGLLHGVYLTVNHAWRFTAAKLWRDRERYERIMKPVGLVLTFACVAISMVVFRAPTIDAAGNLLQGMFGLHGSALPVMLPEGLGPLARWPENFGVAKDFGSEAYVGAIGVWIILLGAIALVGPNTLQMLARYEPALGYRSGAAATDLGKTSLAWNPSAPWAILLSVLVVIAISYLSGQSEFLYWQF